MNNKNIDKWIYGIRNIMVDNGVDDSELSDKQILVIIAGLFIPHFEEDATRRMFATVEENPFAMMYLKSMLSMNKPEGEMFEGLDIELLRAKLNQN